MQKSTELDAYLLGSRQPLRVLACCDSFKGSMTSQEAGEAACRGLLRVREDIDTRVVCMADGGEGTVCALVTALAGEYRSAWVTGPLGKQTEAVYGLLPGGAAVLEMAQSSGLGLVNPEELDPLRASTFGTGELMRAALDAGATRLLIGIGGSATNDGGVGMAAALGIKFLDGQGRGLPPGGGALSELRTIDLSYCDRRFADLPIEVICDVTNPLCGAEGASAVYGAQKGATAADIVQLDSCLAHYADLAERVTGRSVRNMPGAGAAGGLGAGLLYFTQAVFRPGAEVVMEVVDFDRLLRETDLVLTGEGKIDAQSAAGKLPQRVARRAQVLGKPVIALCGSVSAGAEVLYEDGITAIVPIVNAPMSLEEALSTAEELMAAAAERTLRLLLASV
jgi:glycerate kinase